MRYWAAVSALSVTANSNRFCGMIELRPMTNRLDFGTDPDPDLDTEWIFPFLQHGESGHFRY